MIKEYSNENPHFIASRSDGDSRMQLGGTNRHADK
jgi:hypothetical protein